MFRARISEPPPALEAKRNPAEKGGELVNQTTGDSAFDDVAELQHYRRVSAYGVALGLSGYWFFPPASIIALPLNGYSVWNYVRTLKHTKPDDRRSAFAVFESIAVIGSTLTGHTLVSSVVLLTGFGIRNLMLHIGNIAYNHEPGNLTALQQKEVWVLRNGVELLLPVSSLSPSDRIVVNEGGIIPLSGKVVGGSGRVAQFSLEKRLKHVDKVPNNRVYPHTKLHSGSLIIKPSMPH